MTGAKWIVWAFGATGKAGETVLLPQGAHAVAASRQDFVWVRLVTDVPYDAVMWGIEHGVERHGQFDHAQPGTKVPARDGDGVDHLEAKLIGQLAQVFARQGAQIGWGVDGIQQGSIGLVGQPVSPLIKGVNSNP